MIYFLLRYNFDEKKYHKAHFDFIETIDLELWNWFFFLEIISVYT